jgi:tetratricopeptide (TPR) repeat protein
MPRPDIAQLSQLLPTLWIEQGIVDKAVAYLQAEPADVKRWGGVAVDFRRAGKYFAADVVLQLALQRFPEEALLWNERGMLFDAWQKDEAAVTLFDRALQIDPALGPAQFGRARALKKQQRYADAIVAYRLYLQAKPLSVGAHNDIGICHLALEQYEPAITHFSEAIKLDPASPNALFNIAATFYRTTMYDQALETIGYFLGRWPDDAAAQDLREKIRLRPAEPDWIPLDELPHRPQILRGSLTAGWTGAARDPKFETVKPDLRQDEPLGLAEIRAMPPEQARAMFGLRTVDITQFEALFEEKLREPRDANALPKIFLSYRRAPADHAAWVRRLAEDVRARGYEVIFDEFLSEKDRALTVPALVSHLATCTLFVPIITADYALRVEPDGIHTDEFVSIGVDEDSWVFDEYRMGMRLVRRGRAGLAGFWREGVVFPSPFYEGNLIDFRDDRKYRALIERQFPAWAGAR